LTVPRKKVRLIAYTILTAAVAAVGIWYIATAEPGRSILPGCVFYQLTGLYCTGCGMTRAMQLLLHGHLYAAFRMNPLAVAALPFLLVFIGIMIYRTYRGRSMPNLPSWAPWAALVVIVVYTVARNLPWAPFSWLAPTVLPWIR
jgi:hypothetical protein